MFCIHGSPDNLICAFDDNVCWGENDWKVIDITRNRGAPTGKGKGRCMRACLTVDTIDVRSTSSFQGQGPWIYSEFSELTFLPRFMHANARSLVRQTLRFYRRSLAKSRDTWQEDVDQPQGALPSQRQLFRKVKVIQFGQMEAYN